MAGRRHPADNAAIESRLAPYTRFRLVLLITGFVPLLLVPLILRA